MDKQLKKKQRWQHIIAIVISIAKMKTKQCIDEADADDADDATTPWNHRIHDRKWCLVMESDGIGKTIHSIQACICKEIGVSFIQAVDLDISEREQVFVNRLQIQAPN